MFVCGYITSSLTAKEQVKMPSELQDPTAVIPEGFALFKDGPLLRLLRRFSAVRPIGSSWGYRVLIAVGVAWLPLLALSLYEGRAFHGAALPFFSDVQTHVRMLVSLPIYILASHQAHITITPALSAFVERGLVRDNDRERFGNILRAASRWNYSPVFRLAIVGGIICFGYPFWKQALASRQFTAWYGETEGSGFTFTLAGQWLVWVANPLFQYLHVVWLLRLLLYAIVLARIAALDLHLVATHPDHAGGMGFLGDRAYCFFGFAAAENAAVAGVLANRIFNQGSDLLQLKMDILVATMVVVVMVLGPLCVFSRRLLAVRRKGLVEYGAVADRYVRDFEVAWVLGKADREGRELLGTSDIQSLADMAGSYEVVTQMHVVPFSGRAAAEVAGAFLLPIGPLVLTVIPAEELLDNLIRSFLG